VIGHFSSSLRDLASDMASTTAKALFDGVYYLLPNFAHFTFVTETANGIMPDGRFIGMAVIYALAFDAVLLAIAVLVFSRRNFK